MAKQVTLTIDGIEVTVPEGTLVVNAAKKAGIDIPVFCYHPKMEPVGMCRMCLVEIGRPMRDRVTGELVLNDDGTPKISFGPKLETACTTPVSEGMVVLGTTEKVKLGREDIIEFLLTSHPLDCPVCDKGGECPLQNLTMGFAGLSRLRQGRRVPSAESDDGLRPGRFTVYLGRKNAPGEALSAGQSDRSGSRTLHPVRALCALPG